MYTKEFAKIYKDDWSFFAKGVAEQILERLPMFQKEPNHGNLLDLGCGTGDLIHYLEDNFDTCIGIDNSPEMIKIAKKKCKKAKFYVKDVTDFKFNMKFDLITCTFDMINHLPNIEDYKAVFKNVYKHLKTLGSFYFDFITDKKMTSLRMNFKEAPQYDTDKYIKAMREVPTDANHAEVQIKIYNKKRELVHEVSQVESYFNYKDIINALHKAGFTMVNILDQNFKATKSRHADRMYVLCRKF